MNRNHYPPGSPKGGQFAPNGAGIGISQRNMNIRRDAIENGDYDRASARNLRMLAHRSLENGGRLNEWEVRRDGHGYEAYNNGEAVFGVVNGETVVYQEKYRAYAEDFAVASGYPMKLPVTYSELNDARSKLAAYPDGTYNAKTLEEASYDNGYQVTYCQIGDDYSDEEHEALMREFLLHTDDNAVSLGKFEGEPEHSFHFKSKKEAIEFAKEYNQISIWDWAQNQRALECEQKYGIDDPRTIEAWNKCSIDTGGTGRRRK